MKSKSNLGRYSLSSLNISVSVPLPILFLTPPPSHPLSIPSRSSSLSLIHSHILSSLVTYLHLPWIYPASFAECLNHLRLHRMRSRSTLQPVPIRRRSVRAIHSKSVGLSRDTLTPAQSEAEQTSYSGSGTFMSYSLSED